MMERDLEQELNESIDKCEPDSDPRLADHFPDLRDESAADVIPGNIMRIRPMKGYCLVQMLPSEKKVGSFFLAAQAQAEPVRGRVLRIGAWATNKKGMLILPVFKVGDIVIVSKYRGHKLQHDLGERYRLILQQEVLAVLTPEEAAA